MKSPVLLACLTESAATWTLAGIDPGQHRDRAARVRGAGRAVLDQGQGRARARPARAGEARRRVRRTPAPPFSVKLLVDEATMRAQKAALTQLTIGPANRIAMHKHPGAEVLYVLKGHARVLGPTGVGAREAGRGDGDLDPGRDAARDREHGAARRRRCCSRSSRRWAPSSVYRDPKDPDGRAAFEVIRGAAPRRPPARSSRSATPRRDAARVRRQGEDQAAARAGEDRQQSRSTSACSRPSRAPRCRATATRARAEILYVVSGGGDVTIGSEKIPFGAEEALHIPDGQPHAAKFTGADKDRSMVQVSSPPAGPEERYRAAQPAQAKAK